MFVRIRYLFRCAEYISAFAINMFFIVVALQLAVASHARPHTKFAIQFRICDYVQ